MKFSVNIIKDVAKGLGVKIGSILQSPIDGLAEYHKSL